MQDQKQTVKNKVSEGIAWLDSEGLGLARPAAIQKGVKTQISFKYPCKCHVRSAPAVLVVLCRGHSTFKYHIPHEKASEKLWTLHFS